MKHLILAFIFVCGIATIASAHEKGYSNGGADVLEGGESQADALLIPDLPFADSGATCDNTADIAFSCAAGGNGAPDVWYRYDACLDGTIAVSLCQSSYDTAVTIYDSGLGEIICNDDSCGLQSEAAAAVVAGETYYIVVAGFFQSCGDYVIEVDGPSCGVPVTEGTWGQIKTLYQ